MPSHYTPFSARRHWLIFRRRFNPARIPIKMSRPELELRKNEYYSKILRPHIGRRYLFLFDLIAREVNSNPSLPSYDHVLSNARAFLTGKGVPANKQQTVLSRIAGLLEKDLDDLKIEIGMKQGTWQRSLHRAGQLSRQDIILYNSFVHDLKGQLISHMAIAHDVWAATRM